jgi:hypothetical protein
VTGENPLDSSVTAEIDLSSIDTGNEQRDAHIRPARCAAPPSPAGSLVRAYSEGIGGNGLTSGLTRS